MTTTARIDHEKFCLPLPAADDLRIESFTVPRYADNGVNPTSYGGLPDARSAGRRSWRARWHPTGGVNVTGIGRATDDRIEVGEASRPPVRHRPRLRRVPVHAHIAGLVAGGHRCKPDRTSPPVRPTRPSSADGLHADSHPPPAEMKEHTVRESKTTGPATRHGSSAA